MAWTLHHRLHPGLVRPRNEDFVLSDPTLGLLAVADGVGGHAGGDRAAREASCILHLSLQELEGLIRSFPNSKSIGAKDLERAIRSAFEQAHRAVQRINSSSEELRGMSTTLTAALMLGNQALVAHVGDSRAYLVGTERVEQLTDDHLANRVSVRAGGPQGRPLSRAIGIRDPSPDLFWVELPSDTLGLMLCSDGLSDLLVDETEIHRAWTGFGPERACEALVDAALKRGAPDNVAVACIARAAGPEPDPALWERCQALQAVGLFSAIPWTTLLQLVPHLNESRFGARDLIPPLAEAGFRVVMEGRVRLLGRSREVEVGPGTLVEEHRLVTPQVQLYRARALEAVRLLDVPSSVFPLLFGLDPTAASRLLWEALGDLSKKCEGLGMDLEETS